MRFFFRNVLIISFCELLVAYVMPLLCAVIETYLIPGPLLVYFWATHRAKKDTSFLTYHLKRSLYLEMFNFVSTFSLSQIFNQILSQFSLFLPSLMTPLLTFQPSIFLHPPLAHLLNHILYFPLLFSLYLLPLPHLLSENLTGE